MARRRILSAVGLLALVLSTIGAASQGEVEAADTLDTRYESSAVWHSFEYQGQSIDCVDINRQPGMLRSGMEGHEIQVQPSDAPDVNVERAAATPPWRSSVGVALAAEPPKVDCPNGSVPIVRRSAQQLARSAELARNKIPVGEQQLGSTARHQYAAVQRTVDNRGAESDLNLWAPFVERTNEFSLSQISITRGSGGDRQTVEAGWQKYYGLYDDWNSHIFVYFTPDNYNSGCYNLDCPGFVQVNDTYPVGASWSASSISVKGGEQRYARTELYKDGATGHWWLQIDDVWVGYWPRSLFDSQGLESQGATINFYGEIINRNEGQHTRTDMGSGEFASAGFRQAAWQKRMNYIDLDNTRLWATGMSNNVTDASCYSLRTISSTDSNWGEYFYFGGSGFNTGCT